MKNTGDTPFHIAVSIETSFCDGSTPTDVYNLY